VAEYVVVVRDGVLWPRPERSGTPLSGVVVDTLAQVLERRQDWVLLRTEHDQDGWTEATSISPVNQSMAAPLPPRPDAVPRAETTISRPEPAPLYEYTRWSGSYFRVWPNRIEFSSAFGAHPEAIFLRNVVSVQARRALLIGPHRLVVRTNDGRKHEFVDLGDANKARKAILSAL
jgi:hypothetical protein